MGPQVWTDLSQHFESLTVGVGDADDGPTMLATVVPDERDRAFAINYAGDVSGLCVCQCANHVWHGWQRSRSRPGCRERFVGGGGGTVHPRLSLRTGLCLHPLARMRSVLSGASSASNPGARPACVNMLRRVHESLQGRPEVGLLPTPRRCHSIAGVRFRRCELRFHSALAG